MTAQLTVVSLVVLWVENLVDRLGYLSVAWRVELWVDRWE